MTDLQILKSGESFYAAEVDPTKWHSGRGASLGFKTAGSEQLFFLAMKYALDRYTENEFIAFEVGTAEGLTTKEMAAYILYWQLEYAHERKLWMVQSCDLPNGWSLDINRLKRNLPGGSIIDATNTFDYSREYRNRVTVFLSPSEKVLASPVVPHINFAFIDGCHCYQCVFKDFINIAKKLVQNGIIVFHDTGCSIQSPDNHSKHGKHMIYTRLAVEDIIKVFGDGFELLANLEADSNQNGMIIVRKR